MEFVFLIFLVGAVIVNLASKSQRARQWSAVAKEYDLAYKPASIFSSPRISGATAGAMVDVRLLNQNKTSFVQIVAEYPSAPIDFRISRATETGNALRNSVLGQVVENLIGEDVEVGLGAFDDLARIEGDRAELLGYLSADRIAAITYLLENYPGTRINSSEVRVRVSGRDRSSTRLRDALHRTITAAAALSPRRHTAAPPEPEPASSEEPEPSTVEPYDPWTGAHDLPAAPPAPPTRRIAATPSTMPMAAGSMPSSAASMAAELFEGGAVSYESERTFQRDYAGRRLMWMGYVVKSAHGRTTVKVAEIDDPLFGRSEVTVIASATTDWPTGTPVTISGIATELNHLERTITFEDASISA